MMGGVLIIAATASISFPFLLAMGCLLLVALSAAVRREQQG
jgi:hypothetical protein